MAQLAEEAVSCAEAAAGWLASSKVCSLSEAFARDGVCVLTNVIPGHVLDTAARRLDYDAALMVAQGVGAKERGETDASFGGARGRHLEVGLPRDATYSFPEVLSNPIIEQCVHAFLGPAFVRYWCGNTACPGSGVQPLHQDGGGWSVKTAEEAAAAGVAWPHPAYKLSVNFGVDAMAPENGSTEVWPGSHLVTTSAAGITPEVMEARRAVAPPIQIRAPKGAVVFRELRVWHRGQPNRSALPRHMLCLGWCAAADPAPNVTVGGARATEGAQLFSAQARAQLTRNPPLPGIERLFGFVPDAVDHWGHRESEGLQVGGGRDQFWLPKIGAAGDDDPATCIGALAEAEEQPWVASTLRGQNVRFGTPKI
jgi:hypothetical protein